MKQLTYGTPCFEAFCGVFLISSGDFNTDNQHKIKFITSDLNQKAAIFLEGWSRSGLKYSVGLESKIRQDALVELVEGFYRKHGLDLDIDCVDISHSYILRTAKAIGDDHD